MLGLYSILVKCELYKTNADYHKYFNTFNKHCIAVKKIDLEIRFL